MNLKSIVVVPTAKELVDTVLSKTQRKTPTEVHPQYEIGRIRKFYMTKVRFTQQSSQEKLTGIVGQFPKLEEIHPFYADLIHVLYDKDHYKLALGHIHSARSRIDGVGKEYVRLIKYADSLYRCKTLKIAALGKMCTILKKLANSLAYLEEVRQHIARLPDINPSQRTIILTGFPNVGKSSFMNQVTCAHVDVQPYPFTTKSLFVGHTDFDYKQYQVVDTPGLLDSPLEQRNTIEMQAITSLAHLQAVIIYFLDPSETCGNTLQQQFGLFDSLEALFRSKPVIFACNKQDLKTLTQEQIMEIKNKYQGCQIENLSSLTGQGVAELKAKACEAALKMKINISNSIFAQASKPHVALPKPRDSKARPPTIPVNTNIQQSITLKQRQEEEGGAGVFDYPWQEFRQLENDEWKYDKMPEIMDGMNVYDFIDPEIKQKLEELEKEEEMLVQAHIPFDYQRYTDESQIKTQISNRRSFIREESRLNGNKRQFKPPQKTAQELENKLADMGIESSKAIERIKNRSRSRSKRGLRNAENSSEEEEPVQEINQEQAQEMQTLKKVGEKKWKYKKGEADRFVSQKLPKHLYSGKMGFKQQRR